MAGLNSQNLRVAKTIKLFIGGEFPRTESGRSQPVYSKNGHLLYANLCRASRKDLRNAVTAAKGAQGGWEKKSAFNRGQILYRMAEMAEGKRAEFVEVLELLQGYTRDQADQAVDAAIDALVYYAGFTDKYTQLVGCINPVSGPHHNFTTPNLSASWASCLMVSWILVDWSRDSPPSFAPATWLSLCCPKMERLF